MLLYLLIDLIIALILILGSYYGYTRGLFRILVKPARLIACILLSAWLTPLVSEQIISPLINYPIKDYVSEIADRLAGELYLSAEAELPTVMKIAGVIFNSGGDASADAAERGIEDLLLSLADPLVSLVSTVLSFLALTFLSSLLLSLILSAADSVLNIGALGVINRSLGVVCALALAFICAWLFATLVDFTLRLPTVSDAVGGEGFTGGALFTFFKGINPINLLLSF